ncbi:substrate-binding domain-containing protein [Cupriavidus necator]|uniref:substrate-binding domain-containing protein n=1 Tax=Cupriavidus necator TaxID=106590 RepID=UPI00339D8064
MRRMLVACLIGLLAAMPLTAACATEIGVILAGNRSQFWQVLADGIRKAASELGVKITIRGPNEDDPKAIQENLQVRMIESMLERKVDGLILAPMPVAAPGTPPRIPVPLLLLDRESNDYTAPLVATDNFAAGRSAAQTLRGKLRRGARIGVFRVAPDLQATTARENGFVAAAKELGFEVVMQTHLGYDIRGMQTAAASALASQTRKLDAVFTPHDLSTFGVLRAISGLPKDRRPLHVGFDYWPSFEPSLRAGELHAIVVQQPFNMGYQALHELLRSMKAKDAPRSISVGTLVITAARLDDADVRAELARYEKSAAAPSR